MKSHIGGLPISCRGVTFTPDVPLDTAAHGLLGAVLTCSDCREQLGPVRSAAEADFYIAAHLRRTHGFEDVRQVLCLADGTCAKSIKRQGRCYSHHRESSRANAARCSVESCDRPALPRSGLCQGHGKRLRKYGDVRAAIPLRGRTK